MSSVVTGRALSSTAHLALVDMVPGSWVIAAVGNSKRGGLNQCSTRARERRRRGRSRRRTKIGNRKNNRKRLGDKQLETAKNDYRGEETGSCSRATVSTLCRHTQMCFACVVDKRERSRRQKQAAELQPANDTGQRRKKEEEKMRKRTRDERNTERGQNHWWQTGEVMSIQCSWS